METRVIKYKDYRAAIIKEDAFSSGIDTMVKGKHSMSNTSTLPYNDVIKAIDEEGNTSKRNKNYKKINIILYISIAIILIIGIIIFAIIAFGGK